MIELARRARNRSPNQDEETIAEPTYLKAGLGRNMFRVKLRCLKTCSKKVQTKPAPSHACGQLPLNSIFQPPLNKTSQDLCEHIAPSRTVDSLARRNTISWRLVGANLKKCPTSWRPIYSHQCAYGRSPHFNLAWGRLNVCSGSGQGMSFAMICL